MPEGWREVLITSEVDFAAPLKLTLSNPLLNNNTAGEGADSPNIGPRSRLRPVVSSESSATANLLGASSPRFRKLPIGSRLEVSPVAFKTARRVGELLHFGTKGPEDPQGCALIVDYGGEKSYGSSFRVSSFIIARASL